MDSWAVNVAKLHVCFHQTYRKSNLHENKMCNISGKISDFKQIEKCSIVFAAAYIESTYVYYGPRIVHEAGSTPSMLLLRHKFRKGIERNI